MSYSGALVAGDPGAHRRVRFRGIEGGRQPPSPAPLYPQGTPHHLSTVLKAGL